MAEHEVSVPPSQQGAQGPVEKPGEPKYLAHEPGRKKKPPTSKAAKEEK